MIFRVFLIIFVIIFNVSPKAQYPQYPFPYPTNPIQPQPRQPQIIEGSYTFIDSSGVKRTVKYTNGPNGFNTEIEQKPNSTEKSDDKNSTTPVPDKEKKPEENIKYVPVPVYPPVLASRGFQYGGFGSSFRNPYGFQNPYGR